ncbi:MAG: mevalonate kinase [Thermoflexales bacterium]|nr:mevalonate kinase [Thermoflexales bacterium]
MHPVERSACAKVILCGEHAVVYGRPAIALPLPSLRAVARVEPATGGLTINAPDIGRTVRLCDAAADDPLAQIVRLTLAHLNKAAPDAMITIRSAIPLGANLGSGAAVSVAIARALAAYVGAELSAAACSALAFEVEKRYHGTPSGVDNTVIAYEQPVWFVRGCPPEVLSDITAIAADLPLVIADTGRATPTHIPVGDVRKGWERDRARFETLFDAIAEQVLRAREALQQRDWRALGKAMSANHALLQQLDVSCPELDTLCQAALAAGALGAKMSGGGRGGVMLALARDADHVASLSAALRAAGATRIYQA